MRRTALLILILAAALSACQSGPVQIVQSKWQQAFHPCPAESIGDFPVWSADGARIAYSSDRSGSKEIYVISVDDRVSRRLTHVGGSGATPRMWSSDGKQLLINSQYQAGVINADGTGWANMGFPTAAVNGIWSPDSSHLAFITIVGDRPNYTGSLFVADANGSNPTLMFSAGWLSDPAWSPDGKQIAFQKHDVLINKYRLMIINADGTNPVQIGDQFLLVENPIRWSPDGHRLAFQSVSAELDVINADGTGLMQLATVAASDYIWLRDGSALVVQSSNYYGDRIELVSLDGTIRPLAFLTGGHAVLSPDASKVVHVSNKQGLDDLYVMNIDGTDKIRLTHNPGYNTCFDWPF